MEDSNGLAAPAISEELAHTILELKPEMLNYEMMGLLNKKERKALVDRLKGLQNAIRKQQAYEKAHPEVPSKFISDDKWGEFRERCVKDLKGNVKKKKAFAKSSYLEPALIIGTKMI